MKTLLVEYLPRGERSRTAKVLDAFLNRLGDAHELDVLDLCEDAPEMFVRENVLAYIERDYAGLKLSPERGALLTRLDEMAHQLVSCEALVVATPMFNFSAPAIVKAWLDSVLLKGKTWNSGPNGYQGLMAGKRALVIYASGGVYAGANAAWNCLEPLFLADLGLMGFSPIEFAAAQGINQFPEREAEIVAAACARAEGIAATW